MKTIEKTIYSFDELSESAKEKARQWIRETDDGCELEYIVDDFATISRIIGLDLEYSTVKLYGGGTRIKPDVYYSVGYCQSDYAAFGGTWRYEKGCRKAIREYAPNDTELHKIVDAWCALQKRFFYNLRANCSENRDCQYVNDVYRAGFSRYDEQAVDRETEKEAESIVDDLSHWLYKRLRDEVDYQNSDEHVDETIRTNEYEFYENGEVH